MRASGRWLAACVVLSLIACLVLAGCDGGAEHAALPGTPHGFLALGDSYTIGQSVADADRWPVRLATLMKARGRDVGEPTIIARTGWTTGELSDAIDVARPDGPFRIVGLLIGVNDEFRGGTAAAYRPRFTALLDRAIGFAAGDTRRVVVLSIPDWGVMPFAAGKNRAAIERSIDAFNAVDREVCDARHVAFVNVTAVSREAATQPALGATDGLHPSGAQYARWAALADAALRSAGQ